jgi:hypothetical protein
MLLVACCLAAAHVASTQTLQPPQPESLPPVFAGSAIAGQVRTNGSGTMGFAFVAAEPFSAKVVKKAPYSAEATIESVQTLSDGNRISHRQTVYLYRDSEGRTRREETLAAIGPWASEGPPPTIVTIQDPVSGINYVLDSRRKLATKLPPLPPLSPMNATVSATKLPPPPPMGKDTVFFDGPGTMGAQMAMGGGVDIGIEGRHDKEKVASLGKEDIAGVPAEGTRTTTTIPANTIGNERPLEIISEKWSSPELQIVVRTKQSDPRFGETSYEVTTLDKGEPSHALFEVPPDYQVKDGPTPISYRSGGQSK